MSARQRDAGIFIICHHYVEHAVVPGLTFEKYQHAKMNGARASC